MLLAGVAVLYSTWMLVLCSAFFFIRVDNLSFLFTSIFDAARWPIDVFRGWVRWVLTWVLPVAVMTSFPALAILGRLDASAALGALGAALVALLGSRLAWRLSVRHYGSASS
jgi:ABC-2 type transport system permease protein